MEKMLINYTYLYFDRYFGIVAVAVEDITELAGQDALTGGYNRPGICTEGRTYPAECK